MLEPYLFLYILIFSPHDFSASLHFQPRGQARNKAPHDQVFVNCQYSMAVFSTGERKRRPRGDRKSQEMSIHLRQALVAAIRTELYPRSQLDIFVEVICTLVLCL